MRWLLTRPLLQKPKTLSCQNNSNKGETKICTYLKLTKKKWQPVLDHPDLPEVKDSYKRAVTSVILENQERASKEDQAFLSEAAPVNSTGSSVANWDPILISLVRRAMPNLIAYDICGVQPMTGPTGLIFAMRSRYSTQSGTEALFDEADSDFSGRNAAGSSVDGFSSTAQAGTNPSALNDSPSAGTYTTGTGMTTAAAEALGDASGNAFAEMAFSIEKSTVTAKSRALKAEYTMELAQDLKAIHGLDAETELANILSAEILAEINREVVRTIYINAEKVLLLTLVLLTQQLKVYLTLILILTADGLLKDSKV